VSRQRIGQLVKSGDLPTTEGRLLWPQVRDLILARRATFGGKSTAHPSSSGPDAAPAAPDSSALSRTRRETEDATNDAQRYAKARADREEIKARQAALGLAEQEGNLIPVDEVRADAVAVLASVRASLLGLPGQVALRCEGKSAPEIEGVLGDAVNELLAEWHQGRFA